MLKKIQLLSALFAVVLLVGAGCAQTTSTDTSATNSGTDVAVEETTEETTEEDSMMEEMMEGPFAHTELTASVLSTKYDKNTEKGYKMYTFSEQDGTCTDKGFGELVYEYDEDKGYFVGRVGEQEGLSVGVGSTNSFAYTNMESADGTVRCNFVMSRTEETFPVTCVVDEADYCTGDFSGVVQ